MDPNSRPDQRMQQPTSAYQPASSDQPTDVYPPQGAYQPTAAWPQQAGGYAYAPQPGQQPYYQQAQPGYAAYYAPQGGAVPPNGLYPGQPGYGAPYSQGPAPKKKGTAGLVLGIVLLVVGIAVLAVAGYFWFTSQQKYQENEAEYHQLAEANVTEDAATGRPVVDFAALQAQNPEITGWIQIPGTAVNYPVVQHADNDYYLDHSFLGRYDEFGAVFMDYRSMSDLSGRNTVIYGHHLKNGEMFAQVASYSDQDAFNTLTNIYYVSPDGQVHTLVPLCADVVSGYDVDVLQFDFATQADFEAYVQSLIDRSSARSATATSVGVNRIYMLSTCSYGSDNERTILVCTDLNGTNGPVVDATRSMDDIQAAADAAAGITGAADDAAAAETPTEA